MEQEVINQKIEERKNGRPISNIVTALWRYGFENDDEAAIAVECLQDVVNYVGKKFRDDTVSEPNIQIMVQGKVDDLSDKYIYAHSEVYKTDGRNGVCADGDPMSVRYMRIDNGHVFKMKCGKFFRRIVDEMYPTLPEPCRVYFAEQLSAMYRNGHAQDGRYTLTLDRDFEQIYSVEGFGSCMTNKGQWKFYRDSSPDALAAALWDGDRIIARCIVFNKVYDADSDKVYRLAERQYGINSEARRQLVYLLAEQGKIDGHKQFEAGCGDNRNFVLLDGTSLRDKHLYVECEANGGDICSYQDSFRYLCTGEERAYNYEPGDYDYDLSTTDYYVNGDDDEEGRIWVEADNQYYDENDVVWLDYRNEYRYYEDCVISIPEDRDLLDADAQRLWNGEVCHTDNAVELEAGEHKGQYAYSEESELERDYEGNYVLRRDCVEIFAGEHKGELIAIEDAQELESEYYGACKYMPDSDETIVTDLCEIILKEDSVELDGGYYHKDYIVRAMDRRVRDFVDALPDDCVLIQGTYYLNVA